MKCCVYVVYVWICVYMVYIWCIYDGLSGLLMNLYELLIFEILNSRVVLVALVAQLSYDRPTMFSWLSIANILMLLVHMLARYVTVTTIHPITFNTQ
jgi:hypothetical protein